MSFKDVLRAKRDPRFLFTRPLATNNKENPYIPSRFSVLDEAVPGEELPGETAIAPPQTGQVPSPGAFSALGDTMPPEDPTTAPLPSLGDFRKQMQKRQQERLNRGGPHG
jgi:hypothetical protein